MYDREFGDRILAFEPSGGLMNASLIMRDRETDSWWSIITGDAIGGLLTGTDLKEMPVSKKIQWKDWKVLHPDTKVLSVDGEEHDARDPYERYFTSSDGFRGLTSSDKRMYDKANIYVFQLDGIPYAVSHKKVEGGAVFEIDKEREVFVYRVPGSEMFASTIAYVAPGKDKGKRFVKKGGTWQDERTGKKFSKKTGFSTKGKGDDKKHADGEAVEIGGFDTFWYIWSTTHEHVQVLE